MIQTLSNVINKMPNIIRLAKENSKNNAIDFDSNDSDSLIKAYKSSFNSKSNSELLNRFSNLSDDEIMVVQAIMYIGRDELEDGIENKDLSVLMDSYFEELGFELGKSINRDVEIRQMTGKGVLGEYLERGTRLVNMLLN
ncbi:MAG: DUF3775 domain-containing protein [Tissierellaceae bacterium]|nr:DUF3775 domain-containing protein [Tissierellaceae bacterium]